MKFLFKSDYFKYIHPSKPICETKDYSNQELDEAISNTSKIKYSESLMEKVLSNTKISNSQKGNILIFPEVDELKRKIVKSFIKKTFNTTINKLKTEYSDDDDVVDIWEISDGGEHFAAEFVNDKTKERFTPNSISIYFAGCKDYTADYIIEEGIHNCFNSSYKHDKKSNDEDKINFDANKSFLIYNIKNKRFYQLGVHNSKIYHKPTTEYSGYYSHTYSVDLPEAINPQLEGFDFD